MVSSIGSVFTPPSSTAQNADNLFTQNSEMYLSLFLTQLKNQDPSSPFDTGEMTAQLSQLNNSQQMIQTNKNLEQLISVTSNSQASSLASFINKEIEYLGDTFFVEDGGEQSFSYFNDQEYQGVSIEVRNEAGDLVIKTPATSVAGTHDFTWDGKDSLGNPVESGVYKVSVVNENFSGEFGAGTTFLKGLVTGVDFSNGVEPLIFIGNEASRIGVDLSRISAVLEQERTSIAANNESSSDTSDEIADALLDAAGTIVGGLL